MHRRSFSDVALALQTPCTGSSKWLIPTLEPPVTHVQPWPVSWNECAETRKVWFGRKLSLSLSGTQEPRGGGGVRSGFLSLTAGRCWGSLQRGALEDK